MKNKNFVKITIRCQSAEEMQKAKEAVLYHLETLNPEFEANGSTLTVTVVPLDPKLFLPDEACSIKRRERRNKNVFFLSQKNFREARKLDGVGLPLASPDMLYKERTPKTNLRGSQSGGYLLSHNIPQCCPIGDAVSLCPCPLRSLSRAQPTPRMAHTAPHSATPPPMRHTRGGKRRLFLPGQKRYGPSQKRSIGLSFFERRRGGRF